MFDMRLFDKEVKKSIHEYGKWTIRELREITTELLTELKQITPYDTGLASAYWLVGAGKMPRDPQWRHISEVSAPPPEKLARRIRKHGQDIFIVNYAPYIYRLNQGWSAQAPAGFFEEAIDRVVGRWNKQRAA